MCNDRFKCRPKPRRVSDRQERAGEGAGDREFYWSQFCLSLIGDLARGDFARGEKIAFWHSARAARRELSPMYNRDSPAWERGTGRKIGRKKDVEILERANY